MKEVILMREKAAYLKGLVEGLGIDETTKEGKVIKAMSELLCEMAQAIDGIDEDVTQAYDQINDLSEELEDLEADLYEDDEEADEDEADDAEAEEDEDDNADVASEPYYEVACPACGETVYVSEDDLDAGEAICPSCKVAFEVALADDEEAEEEAGARADQGQRGGAAGEHRQADRTGRQIGGDGGTGLTPRQHKTGEHHHERLQRDRHRRARNRNLAGGRGQPHQHGEQHRLPGCGDDTTGERCGGRSGCGGV